MSTKTSLVIRKRESLALTLDEAHKMGLRERPFNFLSPIQADAGNCLTIAHCTQLLDIQQNEDSPEARSLNLVWNRIIKGGKYLEASEDILGLIEFLNAMRFLKVGDRYLAIIPREIPKESLSYEVSLLIKFGINLARIQRFGVSKPDWVQSYLNSNKHILKKLKDIHYQSSISKQFKLYFRKKNGSRLIAITSGSLEIDECRVDQETLTFLKSEIGAKLLISRDPIITVFGWTLRVTGLCKYGTIEMRPETLRALCGDTDGDTLIVTKTRDTVDPKIFLNDILDYYDMKAGDMIGKCSGVNNAILLESEKHQEWNRELTLDEVKSKMDIQIKNLGHTKSATQRCGYWSIIIGQFISENIEQLAKDLNMTVEEASQKYRFLLFKLQQSLTDAKHGTKDASQSLSFKLTDIRLKFNSEAEIPIFLQDDSIIKHMEMDNGI